MTKQITITLTNPKPEVSNIMPAPKLTKWSKEPDIKDLKSDLEAAKPSQQALVNKVKNWQNHMNIEGNAKPKTLKNRSEVQPRLIRKQAEWRYSALSEPFLSTEKMYTVEPATWEDEDGAVQNEVLLNWQFRTKLNSVKFIDEYVRTTTDEGTCYIKVGWKRVTKKRIKNEPVYEFRNFISEEEAETFQAALEMREKNPRGFQDLPEELKAAVAYFDESGIPTSAYPTGEYEQVEEDLIIKNQPTIDILNFQNVYIDPSCEGDISKARFAIISFETSKAELKEDGRYKNLDKINFTNNSILATPDHETTTPNNFEFKDEARKRIVAYEYWGFYDIHGKGELTPIVATWVGDTMIRMERNPFPDEEIPIVVVNYMPKKKSIAGEPDAELLIENQKILGALTRGAIDSMARSANGQRGFAKGVLDVTNRRKYENGEDYEFNPIQDPRSQIIDGQYPELPASVMNLTMMQNQEAESLTGVKSFTGGLSGESYGKVAAGIKGMLDAAAKREMGILRRLAKGMVEIGNKIIAMNAVFLSEEEVVRVTNKKYVVIKRKDLKGNYDLIVDINTAEVDEAKANDLNMMLQTNGNNMDHTMRSMILAEIAELKRMPTLAEKIRNYVPEPDPLEVRMKEAEVQKLEAEALLKQMEAQKIQYDMQVAQAKARLLNSQADRTDLDYVETETGTKHERELEKQREQAKGNQNLEITKSLTRSRKPEDVSPDIEAALGYNRLTGAV